MKNETLNGILTFVLGVLVVVGVICALRVVMITKETRQWQATAVTDNAYILRTKALFSEAQAYDQKYPTTEMKRILQSMEAKPVKH